MKKRSKNPFLDGNFMDYLNPEDEYGMYGGFNDRTGLEEASNLTTKPNDLFGVESDPEESYFNLSEPRQQDNYQLKKANQFKKFKKTRQEALSLGGEPMSNESGYTQNSRYYGESFGGQPEDLKRKSSSGFGRF